MNSNTNFEKRLTEFVNECQQMIDKLFSDYAGYPLLPEPVHLSIERSKKLIKVGDPSRSSSIWLYIDPLTGNFYLPNGYKKRSKEPTGNIFSGVACSSLRVVTLAFPGLGALSLRFGVVNAKRSYMCEVTLPPVGQSAPAQYSPTSILGERGFVAWNNGPDLVRVQS